ncbi:uncharacterized protein CXorf38 isoform X1 [Rhincodon typus]|uniref:uncharacterized protein CXorf38 isoform X1 n=1 Tax=Rhincodon typus TaxID=259920 RepID=UPI0009A42B8E|nr:uncharacterized protein CXorf38 isoform X1 [Rhincodon typus]XP_048458679.1 uncharacterized protein CXorf38 isoform X1 [Rhincodon typus]
MQSELRIRLNDDGYKNWIKAGLCLQKTRNCLIGFVISEMEKFHQFLLHANSLLWREICKNSCRPQGTKFQGACDLCEEWKTEILKHHTNQNNVLYWGNCSPPLWPKQAWEVAKVYMPHGQANTRGPEKCDVAALLNLIISCDWFDFVERQKVIEIIKCRNVLMHSVEMRVSTEWLDNYIQKTVVLLQAFQHIREAKTAIRIIQEIASSDWQVQLTETDAVDAVKFTDEIDAGEILNAELELLREWMQELRFTMEEQEGLDMQHLNSLNTFKEFLKQNEELKNVLHEEVQQLYAVEKRWKNGVQTVKDQDSVKWNLKENEGIKTTS